ncbi:MAG: DUF2442 domain-containing protein [Gallionella sp.]|nr:DUF2442 domain-containing protein [Gallionella sp.]
MKNRDHFRLIKAKVLKNSCLKITYADGTDFNVDLSDWIKSSSCLKPLQDQSFFASAKLREFGRAVEFGKGEIDLAADNLRNLAIEQSGGIGHERIWNWMHKNNLTLDGAAEVLGISRRMLAYYRNGEKPIPRHIWLACVGWETLHKHGKAA